MNKKLNYIPPTIHAITFESPMLLAYSRDPNLPPNYEQIPVDPDLIEDEIP